MATFKFPKFNFDTSFEWVKFPERAEPPRYRIKEMVISDKPVYIYCFDDYCKKSLLYRYL